MTFILAVIVCCYPNTARADTKTNLEVLEQLYFEIFDEFLVSSIDSDTSCVIVRPANAPDYAWMIEAQLYKSLQHVYMNEAVDKPQKVNYQPIMQAISYDKIKKKQLERTVNVKIFCQIVNPQNKVVFSDVLAKSYIDSIYAKSKQLESVQYPFTVGQQKKSLLAIFYEPVLVTAIAGVVIYLFYSYRSQ